MNGLKQNYLLLILALLVLAALAARAQASAAVRQHGRFSEATAVTPLATLEPSPTVSATPTMPPAASPSPTATASATATPQPAPTAVVSYLPLLMEIPPPAPQGCEPEPHIPGFLPSNETELADLINAYRQNNGLPRLVVLPSLTQAARRHAYDMAANDLDSHTGSDDSGPPERVEDACYEWVSVGEILGIRDSASEVFNDWIRSESNRALILAPRFEDMGLAYVFDPDSRFQYYWVVVFGRPAVSGTVPRAVSSD